MLQAQRLGEAFAGTEIAPGKILGAFKAAAPYLGFSPRVVHAIDWLFRFTQPQDWTAGSRPIVWPSAAVQREDLALSDARTKALNRHLAELGLITMKDSPTGKRYGLRNRAGHIIEAYGFDLSPLGTRVEEFLAVAEKARVIRDAIRAFRRRVTIARKAIYQILETAQEHGLYDPAWQAVAAESQRLVHQLAACEGLEELAAGVAQLERSQENARTELEAQLARLRAQSTTRSETVKTSPTGPENEPLNTSTKQLSNLKDTVIASVGRPARWWRSQERKRTW
jgi:replication initiation protein RepC